VIDGGEGYSTLHLGYWSASHILDVSNITLLNFDELSGGNHNMIIGTAGNDRINGGGDVGTLMTKNNGTKRNVFVPHFKQVKGIAMESIIAMKQIKMLLHTITSLLLSAGFMRSASRVVRGGFGTNKKGVEILVEALI